MAAADAICVAAIGSFRPLASLLAVGLGTLFILLCVLVWTRFGQARPVSKCVVLSLLAHLLLLTYAYSTHILYGPPGRWTGQVVTVRLRDAADDVEAAPSVSASPKPWEQPGLPDVPLLLAAPGEREVEQAPPITRAEQELERPSAEQQVADNVTDSVAPLDSVADQKPPATPQQPDLSDLLEKMTGESPAAETITQAEPPASPPASPTESLAADSASAQRANDGLYVASSKGNAPRRLGDGQPVPQPLEARVQSDRLKAAQPFGATANSEAAVAAALDWLARAQDSNGRWNAAAYGAGRETKTLGHDRRGAGAQADTGVSGLALLAFLGSGETHLAGAHREKVQRGLEYLLSSQTTDGCLSGNAELFAAMYCHGMATLALSEAYALSGDDRLLPGLQRALAYTTGAQSSAGGWRYRPNEPADPGDMSQFGWQLMALKSAEMGGLPMPTATRARMIRFLQSCSSGRRRGLAGYRPGDRVSTTMTAEALACRYFLEAENSPPALDEAAAQIMLEPPTRGTANYYYWYYGTLALFQRQGEEWRRWNAAVQAELLARQRWDGQATGSYDPDDLWGGYGGRVYSTALATLCLEVYYRYLPIHGRDPDDSRLTDRPWQPAVAR